MALESSLSSMRQRATKNHNQKVDTFEIPKSPYLGSERGFRIPEEEEEEPKPKAQKRQHIDTATAYIEDTSAMEVSYASPRHEAHAANDLALAIDHLADHRPPECTDPSTKTSHVNPFDLDPAALQTWHAARAVLHYPSYFHSKMRGAHRPIFDDSLRVPPKESFVVRNLQATLEIEQGLADLRVWLGKCHGAGDDGALEGLRRRVGRAVEGLVREDSSG